MNDGLVKGGQTNHRLQSAVVAVAGHPETGPLTGSAGSGCSESWYRRKNQASIIRILLQQRRSMAARPLWLSLRTEVLSRKSLPLIHSRLPVLLQHSGCVHFALGIGRAWYRRLSLPWGPSPHPSAPVPPLRNQRINGVSILGRGTTICHARRGVVELVLHGLAPGSFSRSPHGLVSSAQSAALRAKTAVRSSGWCATAVLRKDHGALFRAEDQPAILFLLAVHRQKALEYQREVSCPDGQCRDTRPRA